MPIQALATHPLPFVKVRELADYWLVSAKQIHKYISSGALPAVRVGRRCFRIPTRAAAEFERRLMERPPNTAAAPPRSSSTSFALIRGRDSANARSESVSGLGDSSTGVHVGPGQPRRKHHSGHIKDVSGE